MGLFDSLILQAILFEDALNSLERLDEEDSDSDMQEITHCSNCAHWKKSENANNVGDCTLRNEPMFREDFCSKAEERNPNKTELTEEEVIVARFLYKMGVQKVSYDNKSGHFAFYDCFNNKVFSTWKEAFPTIKKHIQKNYEINLFDVCWGRKKKE